MRFILDQSIMILLMKKIFIFIDSKCIICNKFALLCLKYEKSAQYNFYFSGLDSEYAKNFFKKHNKKVSLESVCIFKNQKFYAQTDGIIEIAKCCKFPAYLLALIQFIPKKFRDKVYILSTQHRHKFNKQQSCMQIQKNLKSRFITEDINS